MRPTALHPVGRDGPKPLSEIDLRPSHIGDLALALAGQDQQPEHRAVRVAHRAGGIPHRAQLVIREGPLARLPLADQILRFELRDGRCAIPNS